MVVGDREEWMRNAPHRTRWSPSTSPRFLQERTNRDDRLGIVMELGTSSASEARGDKKGNEAHMANKENQINIHKVLKKNAKHLLK